MYLTHIPLAIIILWKYHNTTRGWGGDIFAIYLVYILLSAYLPRHFGCTIIPQGGKYICFIYVRLSKFVFHATAISKIWEFPSLTTVLAKNSIHQLWGASLILKDLQIILQTGRKGKAMKKKARMCKERQGKERRKRQVPPYGFRCLQKSLTILFSFRPFRLWSSL